MTVIGNPPEEITNIRSTWMLAYLIWIKDVMKSCINTKVYRNRKFISDKIISYLYEIGDEYCLFLNTYVFLTFYIILYNLYVVFDFIIFTRTY